MWETISNMQFGEVVGSLSAVCIILSTIIQVSPIKLNPWSWIAKKVGRAINGEILEKVEKLETEVQHIEHSADERDAKAARVRILRFGDELLHNVQHSKEHFDEILSCVTDYTQYCKEHPEFLNHMTDRTVKLILSTYDKCMEEHKFL